MSDIKPGQRYRHGWIPIAPGFEVAPKWLSAYGKLEDRGFQPGDRIDVFKGHKNRKGKLRVTGTLQLSKQNRLQLKRDDGKTEHVDGTLWARLHPPGKQDPNQGEFIKTNGKLTKLGKREIAAGARQEARRKSKLLATSGPAANTETRTAMEHNVAAHEYPVITAAQLSTDDARRSPEVSPAEFQEYAKRGEAKLATFKRNGSTPRAISDDKQFDAIIDKAYAETRQPWGGITVDSHSGQYVDPQADKYALTARDPGHESVTVAPDASIREFYAAMYAAREQFADELRRGTYHLGVFYDQDTGKIEIDPVIVTQSLRTAQEIGAFTRAVGGAFHFKSGDGFWPPHVREADMSTSYITPEVHDNHLDLASEGGKLAFWKQILPMRRIAYTAKDGTRRTLDFTRDMLTELASAKGVDKLGFLLADKDNRHTMDPDRWRGEVAELAVRDDGLYGKIVFPNADAAKAVIDNPDLGVSARIRENVPRDDGRTVPRALIHVLGTLDPQVSGMSPWQAADLSTEQDEVLDLSDEEYTEMPKQAKALADYTEADIDAMTETELDAFLAEHAPDFDPNAIEAEVDADEVDDPADEAEEEAAAKELVDASKDGSGDIELANQRADRAEKRANEALRRQAAAEWETERAKYLGEGVPAASLDLAAPLLNRADDMVIDLSSLDEDDVNVSQIVRGLLDGQKGTVDLSDEQGHGGHFNPGEGEDPDAEALAAWDKQF